MKKGSALRPPFSPKNDGTGRDASVRDIGDDAVQFVQLQFDRLHCMLRRRPGGTQFADLARQHIEHGHLDQQVK
jgi:hypothetical protein